MTWCWRWQCCAGHGFACGPPQMHATGCTGGWWINQAMVMDWTRTREGGRSRSTTCLYCLHHQKNGHEETKREQDGPKYPIGAKTKRALPGARSVPGRTSARLPGLPHRSRSCFSKTNQDCTGASVVVAHPDTDGEGKSPKPSAHRHRVGRSIHLPWM